MLCNRFKEKKKNNRLELAYMRSVAGRKYR